MVLLPPVNANTVPVSEQIRVLSGVVHFPYRATNFVAVGAGTLYGGVVRSDQEHDVRNTLNLCDPIPDHGSVREYPDLSAHSGTSSQRATASGTGARAAVRAGDNRDLHAGR